MTAGFVYPVAKAAFESLMFDMPLPMAATVDFGVDTVEHYAALQRAVRGGITVEQLSAALGDGPALTELVKDHYPSEVVFVTSYDLM